MIEENNETTLFNKLNIQRYNNENYCIFDWDNTCVIADTQDTTVMFMIERQLLKIEPDDMFKLLDISQKGKTIRQKYSKGNNKVTFSNIIKDIENAYINICNDIEKDVYIEEMKVKVFLMYNVINSTIGQKESYHWIMRFFNGYSEEEIEKLSLTVANNYFSKQVFNEVLYSPSVKSIIGPVSVKIRNGLNVNKEVFNLIQELVYNEITVYIVTASFENLIKGVIKHSVFNNLINENNVYGARVVFENNKYTNNLISKYPFPVKDGKVTVINRYIKEMNDPLLIAGDSFGDYKMLTNFANNQNILLFKNNKLLETMINKQIKQELNPPKLIKL